VSRDALVAGEVPRWRYTPGKASAVTATSA